MKDKEEDSPSNHFLIALMPAHSPDFHDHHDHFKNSTPESEWKSCLEHAEKIGIGTREYELIK